MPDLDPIVDAETRRERRCEQEATVWGPFAVGCVWRVYGAYFREGAAVYDLDFPSEVTEPSERDESALWVKGDEVVR